MKKVMTLILALVVSMTLFGFDSKAVNALGGTKKEPLKIGFFVSDYSNTFHQAQYEAAKKYAKEKFGANVILFDGKGNSATMTKNLDQILAQGIDMATLHLWDDDAALPIIKECLAKKVVMASFFGPFKGSGIPAVRNNEASISHKMGVEMATAWKKAHPDKPIVMVELGWPDNNEVITGRTNPFVEGVKSVDAKAVDLGCQDASGGADAAKSIMAGILNSNPKVNLIYAEASNLATGVMSALTDAGRGVLNKDGTPATELVCSCDFDDAQYKEIYVNNSSLVASLGLSPSETGIARIQNLMDIKNGKIKQKSTKEQEIFCSAYCCSKYSMSKKAAVSWLSKHWGIKVK